MDPHVYVAAIDPIYVYAGAILILTGILVAAALMQIRPTRRCPTCTSRVDLTRRRCQVCGYDFSPIRMTR